MILTFRYANMRFLEGFQILSVWFLIQLCNNVHQLGAVFREFKVKLGKFLFSGSSTYLPGSVNNFLLSTARKATKNGRRKKAFE